jgi:hypothetical protein
MACDVRYRTKSALVIWVLWQLMTRSRHEPDAVPLVPQRTLLVEVSLWPDKHVVMLKPPIRGWI